MPEDTDNRLAAAANGSGRGSRDPVSGLVFDIQRFSVHDGPGIRTTVFLKGCPLRCRWCHNPESQDTDPEISFLPNNCIGCGYCLRRCPEGAHRLVDDSDGTRRHLFDRSRCVRCGSCTAECWADALELVGRRITVEEAIAEVRRDESFYAESGGGLTLSGGEPLFQPRFTEELLRAAKECGVHTAVETCGFASADVLMRARPFTDLFLYDLKETDDERHAEYTGVPLAPIVANLRLLCDVGAAIRLRLPIVPGLNDREDHFESIAALVASCNTSGDRIEAVEIMPYHALGTDKLGRFDRSTPAGLPRTSVTSETVASWQSRLRESGLPVV